MIYQLRIYELTEQGVAEFACDQFDVVGKQGLALFQGRHFIVATLLIVHFKFSLRICAGLLLRLAGVFYPSGRKTL